MARVLPASAATVAVPGEVRAKEAVHVWSLSLAAQILACATGCVGQPNGGKPKHVPLSV